jgi:SagB-type dehydrogenase family enzyme
MKVKYLSLFLITTAAICWAISTLAAEIPLPKPVLKGTVSVEEALSKRRSVRSYSPDPLPVGDVSQLLWAAQGITATGGKRTAPSAGAIYPLNLYLIAGNVKGLASGAYRYVPEKHTLEKVAEGDLRLKLAEAASMQRWVGEAPAAIVFTVNYSMMGRYKDGKMFADFEVGHAAQNLMLEAVALNLGTVAVGSLNDGQIQKMLNISPAFIPVYLIPVGHPK